MIVDSSALIAVLRGESDADVLLDALTAQPGRISAATWLEAAMVAEGAKVGGGAQFDRLVEALELTVEPVTVEQARAARVALRRYGRGSGSPARLNFGDCLAYALSATSGEPLLFKGDDFTHTDVLRAR